MKTEQLSMEQIQGILLHLLETGEYPDQPDHTLIPTGSYQGEWLATITRQHVINAWNKYLTGTWNAIDLEDWANAVLTYRHYLTYEAGYGSLIDDILCNAASFGETYTPQNTKNDIATLQNTQYNPNDATT